MYATCLFCNKALGHNEALETFPVGKRLAFDAAKGRLWVVCSHCERWNLSPLEERWEVIEAADKLYRDTRRRVATDNIGLAKLADGTTLVRIGEPLRPEFAAWRYGDQFGRRRRRQLLVAGGGVAAIATLLSAGVAAGLGIGLVGPMIGGSINVANGKPESVVAKIRTDRGSVLHVRRRHLGETSLARGENGELVINLRFKNGQGTFVGGEAERIAAIVVPKVNRFGGDTAVVADAVREIESMGSAERYLDHLSTVGAAITTPLTSGSGRQWWRAPIANGYSRTGLFALPKAHRLALEMALHEEAERRAIEGELADLKRAWREAEEIAGIADSLLVPDDVTVSINRLRTYGDER
jgi:hypothetical protein